MADFVPCDRMLQKSYWLRGRFYNKISQLGILIGDRVCLRAYTVIEVTAYLLKFTGVYLVTSSSSYSCKSLRKRINVGKFSRERPLGLSL